MAAEPPENSVTEAVHSLEVRWIFPGQLAAANHARTFTCWTRRCAGCR
jgi:hypothetical protein